MAGHSIWNARSLSIDPNLDHPHLVLLEAESAQHLEEIIFYLNSVGIKFSDFYENYYSEPLVSLATQPILEDQRHLFANFNLLKESKNERNV